MTKPAKGLAKGLTNYGDAGFSLYLRRSFAKSMGYSGAALEKPIVGIADSRSGFNNCHRHFPELVEAVKRGVLAAGGLPIDFPTISLGEVFLSPTSMMFRNLMAIDVEEMIRAQPMDAVVLIGGCDKTVPAQLMGAASADVPAVQLLAGPMMPMAYRGERLGACTDCRRFWAKYRAGGVTADEIERIEENLATTAGTCAVMAVLAGMGLLGRDQTFVHESIIGTRFRGGIAGETFVSEIPAIVPEIEGDAWITGEHTFVIDGNDPLRRGFRL